MKTDAPLNILIFILIVFNLAGCAASNQSTPSDFSFGAAMTALATQFTAHAFSTVLITIATLTGIALVLGWLISSISKFFSGH